MLGSTQHFQKTLLENTTLLVYNRRTFPGSSMVEQEAVNFEVAGSSPVPGAKLDESPIFL